MSPPSVSRRAAQVVLVLVISSFAAAAGAQSADSDAPPPPPEPGSTPAVSPPSAAPRVFPGAGAASTWDGAAGDDSPESPDHPASGPPAEPLLWAGTSATWGSSFSAQLLGVDSDHYIGADESSSVGMSFDVSAGFFLLRRPAQKLRVSTSIGFDARWASNLPGTRESTVLLRDIPIGLSYTGTLFSTGQGKSMRGLAALRDPTLQGTGDHRTWLLARGALYTPTSEASQARRLLTTTSLVLGLRQQVKLLGGDAPGLTHALVSWTGGWSHPFYGNKANAWATGPNGTEVAVTSTRADTENILGTTFRLTVPLYGDLQLDGSFSWERVFKYRTAALNNDCIQIMTGCVTSSPSEAPTAFDLTAFDVSLSYLFTRELGLEIGYFNSAFTSKQYGPFFSPNAVFYGDLVFSIDRFYERLAGP